MSPLRFRSIRKRLAFWFLMVALVPLIVVSAINYRQRVAAIEKRAFNKLTAIRDLKINEINNWLDRKISELKTIAGDPEIRQFACLSTSRPSDALRPGLVTSVRQSLDRFMGNYSDFQELIIIDADSGVISVSTNRELEGVDRSTNPYFTGPLENKEVFIKDIFYSKTLNDLSMTFSMAIGTLDCRNGPFSGVLVLRVNLTNSIYKLLMDRTGMNDTGETFIVNSRKMALNQLRNSVLHPLQVKIDDAPIRNALSRQTGIMEAVDYRGQPVLSAYGFIPRTEWGFVAKQDLAEINAPVERTLADFFYMVAISLLGVYLAAVLLSQSIARPVLEMTRTSKKIQDGDLTARNKEFPPDELGFLAQAYNEVADSLFYQLRQQKAGTEITETLVRASSLDEFSRLLMDKLLELTESSLSAFYLYNAEGECFEPFASMGMVSEWLRPFRADGWQREFGRILANGEVVHRTDISPDTIFRCRTFAGDAIPRDLLSIPLSVRGEIMGILALGSLKPYSRHSLDLINQSWTMAMNTAFANCLANRELNDKNKALQVQATELAGQADTLKRQSAELRHKNIELEIKRIQVEEANQLKSQFLSNMSHELRTPLNSVLALSRVLRLQALEKLTPEEANYLEIIERNGKNLLELINDILDLAKIEAGRMDIRLSPFSPAITAENIMEQLRPVAREKNIQLVSEFSKDFPRLESDENRVHQILQNLIGNAIKFTPKGNVTVSGNYNEQYIHICVKDTGIGIPGRDLPHIFEEFRQADGTSTRKYEGTGLGLTIASRAATLLGGKIDVESAVGQGTTFTLSLPRHWSGPAPEKARDVQPPHRHQSILVVDDDPEIVGLISGFLVNEGYTTMTATSGAEALCLARKHIPDAITLDIIMPEMDGIEVLQGLKQDPVTCNIPVIMVSISDDRATGIALGAMGYVTKPVTRTKLLAEIRKISRPRTERRQPNSVLVVDDNEFDRNQIIEILDQAGMGGEAAGDGREAITKMSQTPPDVVILDLIMPEMDGFQVLRHMRADKTLCAIPVIIITAKDLTPEETDLLSGQAQAILAKSNLSPPRLMGRLKKILEGTQQTIVPTDTPVPPQPVAAPSSREPVVLVIEDNPDNLAAIQAVLGKRYRLLDARTGEAGLRLAQVTRPDLILLDMALPGMDGLSVVRRLRDTPDMAGIPTIALTAQAMKGDREKFLKAGCDDFIPKPFDPDRLLETISMWLSRKSGKEASMEK